MTRRLTVKERRQLGKEARAKVPRSSHADWEPAGDRADPVAVVEAQNSDRVKSLVPIRHGRMLSSAFSFYRGAAAIMAADLAPFPTTGITVQACGDAHLSNFGVFASPERTLVFDINDFDETLPGPWEWDVKRLAASFIIAGRHNGFNEAQSHRAALRSVLGYQSAMAEFAEMTTLAVWYSRLRAKDIAALAEQAKGKKTVKRRLAKAKTRDSVRALSKLAAMVDGEYQILADPPYVVPLREASDIMDPAETDELVQEAFEGYFESLSDDRKKLLSRYRVVDVAHKLVGVGSVGTRCFIALLEGRDHNDPLFLQAKEASPSVLEDHLSSTPYEQHGQRVVEGQRLIQAASDIFLGWVRGRYGRDFYFRQLRDMKGDADVDRLDPQAMGTYGALCGWTLARGHARSGDPVAIAGYLGKNDTFAEAIAEFANRYADRNEGDYTVLNEAVASGRLETAAG